MHLSIIIPAYNEENRLPLTLEKIFEYLSIHYQDSYELIVADDGSTDSTPDLVLRYQTQYPQLKLLRFAQNRGRGAVVRDAVLQAQGEYILETDADGSVNEHAIVSFLNYFSKHPEVDMLIGSRMMEGAKVLSPQPLHRLALGYGFVILAYILFRWPWIDRVNGFKMFRREVALDIFRNQFENSFLAEAEIVYVAEKRGWKVKELPILWTDYRGSQVRPLREAWRSTIGMFKILWRSRRGLYSKNLVQVSRREPPQEKSSKDYSAVLITGGAGFIGSNFVRYFYDAHPRTKIANLDLLTYAGNPDNLRDLEAREQMLAAEDRRYRFVQGDICDAQLLEQLFAEYKFDLVVHFAAESHVDRSIFNMGDFVRTNIEGTRTLAEAARRHGVSRFVHISTDEVYGSIKHGYADENWPLHPSNPYSASKAGADLLVQAYVRTHELPAVIIRGSNNYGPFQYPEKLIPLAITNMLEGKKVPVHGYGIHVRSWLHVLDFCRAIDLVAHRPARHLIYNVAGEERTNHEVLELIAAALSKNLSDFRIHVHDRPGADLRYAVDGSRLSSEFGWEPIHQPFEEHIHHVVLWYGNKPEWWQSIRLKEGFLQHYERQSKGQWS